MMVAGAGEQVPELGSEARPFGDELVREAEGTGFYRILRLASDREAADFMTAMARSESGVVDALQRGKIRKAWVWKIQGSSPVVDGHVFYLVRGVLEAGAPGPKVALA